MLTRLPPWAGEPVLIYPVPPASGAPRRLHAMRMAEDFAFELPDDVEEREVDEHRTEKVPTLVDHPDGTRTRELVDKRVIVRTRLRRIRSHGGCAAGPAGAWIAREASKEGGVSYFVASRIVVDDNGRVLGVAAPDRVQPLASHVAAAHSGEDAARAAYARVVAAAGERIVAAEAEVAAAQKTAEDAARRVLTARADAEAAHDALAAARARTDAAGAALTAARADLETAKAPIDVAVGTTAVQAATAEAEAAAPAYLAVVATHDRAVAALLGAEDDAAAAERAVAEASAAAQIARSEGEAEIASAADALALARAALADATALRDQAAAGEWGA